MTDQSGVGGITILHSGWGAKFIDYDNDGWRDLFVAQGHVMDNIDLTDPGLHYLEPPILLKNSGGKFRDVSRESGHVFGAPIAARGAAFGDLDNDGFIDVVINCHDGHPLVLRNTGGNGNHWLSVHLVGRTSNRDGIGAKVRVVADNGAEQYAFVNTAGSYLSASDKRVHFGLGAAKKARFVEVTWPGGIVQRLEAVAVDQILTINEPAK